VEIVGVRGPDGAYLAEVQLEAIREVLAWALSQHDTDRNIDNEDRAA
jgi:GDP-D-mannose dehydratase